MALRETLMQIRSQPPSTGLSAALLRVIQPLLSDLGWTVSDPAEVGLDHGSVDVVLSVPRGEHASLADRRVTRPALYIKVVETEQDLAMDAASVVTDATRDGVDLCALTTGPIWWLYLPKATQPTDNCRYAEWDLQTDPTERLADELEMYLGRDALVSQRSQRSAEHALTTRLNAQRLALAIPAVWRRLLAGPDSFLIEYVQEEVRKETGLHPAAEQVAEVIRGSAVAHGDSSSAVPTRVSLGEPSPNLPAYDEEQQLATTTVAHDQSSRSGALTIGGRLVKPPQRRVTRSHGSIRGFRVLGEEFDASRWLDVWLGVTEWLFERHSDEFESVAFQYRGKSRQYISDSPGEHTAAKQIGTSPYFAEGNLSGAECENRSRDLLERFGYGRDALTIVWQ